MLRYAKIKLPIKCIFLVCFAVFSGCTAKKESTPETINPVVLNPEQTDQALEDIGDSWLYGDGIGTTILNVGTTVFFPPYGVFLLGNFAMSASGYEPLGVSSFLEGDAEEDWDSMYSTVVSGPGRMVAAMSGEEYRSAEKVKKTLEKYTQVREADGVLGDY